MPCFETSSYWLWQLMGSMWVGGSCRRHWNRCSCLATAISREVGEHCAADWRNDLFSWIVLLMHLLPFEKFHVYASHAYLSLQQRKKLSQDGVPWPSAKRCPSAAGWAMVGGLDSAQTVWYFYFLWKVNLSAGWRAGCPWSYFLLQRDWGGLLF